MTQPPYRQPEGHPMRRFAFFSAALLVLVIIGSVPWKARGLNNSLSKSMCVCVPTRAAMFLRSMTTVAAIHPASQHAKR